MTNDSPNNSTNLSNRPPAEVVVVGGGHNGLVAAAILARSGKRVTVLERSQTIGGAARTEYPFTKTPKLGCSTGAYLLGPMPPEVIQRTGIRPRLIPRRPHGFLLLGNGLPAAFGTPAGSINLSETDKRALDNLDAVLVAIRDDIAPAWLRSAVGLDESARLVRDTPAAGIGGMTVRSLYLALAAEPIGVWLDRFGFSDRQLLASVATDAFVGSSGGPSSAGMGMNFLAHNMLRLPAGDGDSTEPLGAWQLVEGGMGEITRLLGEAVREAGGVIRLNAPVDRVVPGVDGSDHAVHLADGSVVLARHVIVSADPMSAVGFVDDAPHHRLAGLRQHVQSLHERGTSLKVNLALSRLPAVHGSEALLGSPTAALSGTVHVLPVVDPMSAFERASSAVRAGRWPDPADAMIDVYTHTAVDPTLCDAPPEQGGHHAMSLFIQWVPPNADQASAEKWVDAVLRAEPMRRFFGGGGGGGSYESDGGGLTELVVDRMVLTPSGIEQRFGIAGGHIHHLDNRHAWTDRPSERTPIDRLWLASAGCHPAGSVIGAAGLIAADGVLGEG